MGFSVSTKLDIVKKMIANNIDNISSSINDIDAQLQDVFEQTVNDPEDSKKNIDEIKVKWLEIKESSNTTSKETITSFKDIVEKTAHKYSKLFPTKERNL